MRKFARLLVPLFAGVLLLAPLTGCGDDEDEDKIGDGEINDEGD